MRRRVRLGNRSASIAILRHDVFVDAKEASRTYGAIGNFGRSRLHWWFIPRGIPMLAIATETGFQRLQRLLSVAHSKMRHKLTGGVPQANVSTIEGRFSSRPETRQARNELATRFVLALLLQISSATPHASKRRCGKSVWSVMRSSSR